MNPKPRPRGSVVIVRDGSVALIKRLNDRGLYYVFPGGGVEDGESPADAAVREAREELGLDVRIIGLLAVVTYKERDQYFYAAKVVGGVFGTGTGPEFSYPSHLGRGSYTPMWVPLDQLSGLKVHPRALADYIASGVKELPATPLRIVEDA